MRILQLGGLLLALSSFAAEDPFKANVRPTDPLSPEAQLATFHLPAGFEIQLVAAEPELRKPMNMAFDSAGRLWVTESREYPFAAPTNSRPQDTIRIFSDFDTNGRARSMSVFATNLNIPIGLYPYRSPNTNTAQVTWKCVAWSIPNIWQFEDVDGDGRADATRKLYGPFDYTRDTHGNQASLRRGEDGWVYATHGFNNQSRVAGGDGHEVELISGNTYRFRLDGSRLEKWTHGQVNPFGLGFDRLGNLFSADCHSSPIYQLLRGAYYPSFGRPHDGLGFAPRTIQHSHGSTAIAGLVVVQDPAWPDAFQGNILVGNVMTSRLNRDRLEWRGSSTIGHELDDFLSCDDPWFRPVDLQWGPDGALYVADFYNRIIGHYEVPRDHPGRDRERGRIWRIVYRGDTTAISTPDKMSANLLAGLGSANPTLRSLALNETCDVIGRAAGGEFRALLGSRNEYLYSAGLWGMHRLRLLSERELLRALIAPATLPRLAALRIAGDLPEWTDNIASIVSKSVNAENAHLRRVAAETLGLRTNRNDVAELVGRFLLTGRDDTHLRHVLRIAARNQLSTGGAAAFDSAVDWSKDRRAVIRELALAVKTSAAATFLLSQEPATFADTDLRQRAWKHIATHAADDQLREVIDSMAAAPTASIDQQLDLLRTISESHSDAGQTLRPSLAAWAGQLADELLAEDALDEVVWGNLPPDARRYDENPWGLQKRKCADNTEAELLSSHPHGERLRGRLRSRPFKLPARLSFYLCGHDGRPKEKSRKRNRVRLRLVDSNQVLKESYVPRHDTARRVEWDLGKHVGQLGYFEAEDGLADSAYAWLAFGRFEPELPELTVRDARQDATRLIAGAELVGRFGLRRHVPVLQRLLTQPNVGFHPRRAAAETLAGLIKDELALPAAKIIGNRRLEERTRDRFASEMGSSQSRFDDLFRQTLKISAAGQQAALGDALAANKAGGLRLLEWIEQGVASPVLLRNGELRSRIETAEPEHAARRIDGLLALVPDDELDRGRIIQQRLDSHRSAGTSIQKGREVFELACATCHQIAGKGRVIGPQLDGIGGRGVARVMEDILAPNRNVDLAFRAETIRLKNGKVLSGLPRTESDKRLVIANLAAEEQILDVAEIEERIPTTRSLMPDNFNEALTEAQFHDLIAYLLAN